MSAQARFLTLVRHAEAAEAAHGQPDRDRPLTERGRRQASALAPRLGIAEGASGNVSGAGGDRGEGRPAVPAVDLVACSDARRTRRTLALLLPALGAAGREAAVEGALYLAGADALAARADAAFAGGARHALILGHNPGLERLCARLAGAPGLALATCERVTLLLPAGTAAPGTGEIVLRDAPRG